MTPLLANVCFFGLIAGFSALSVLSPDAYYQYVQEDQPLEWSTFWGFMVAGAFFARATLLDRHKGPPPWFFAGLAAFCVLVAMEEISWGQRVFGYTPPRYFLDNNYQLELNLHNVLPTTLRKQIVAALIVSYGLLLPLLVRIPSTRSLLTKLGIAGPPLALTPIFAGLLVFLVTYPIPYAGEIVEAGMALGFLFSAIAALDSIGKERDEAIRWPMPVGSLSLIVALGFGAALWSRFQLAADPVVAEVARTEIRALEHDIRQLMKTNRAACGKHERINLIANRFPSDKLTAGRFMSLTRRGLSTERAEFFLDPWSTAYWIRATCNEKRDKVFVYSFGPNRRRDSSRWELRDDDIGVLFRVRKDDQRRAQRSD